MSDEERSAAAAGFAMPPEWAPQEAVWLSWPVDDPRHWGGAKREAIEQVFVSLAAAISRFAECRVNGGPGLAERIGPLVAAAGGNPDAVQCFDHPHNDVWCRDHGPIFVKHRETGEIAVVKWGFNAWGGKFPPWDLDNAIPHRIAEALGLRCFEGGMILEGGAIELNGRGQLLTTEAVLLNPNRNPQLGREEIEMRLCAGFGIEDLLWLARGIEGDDTDGHIDDLARFVDDETIVAAVEPDRGSPNHEVLAANLERLRGFRTADGSPFRIVEMPMPSACEVPGWRLPVLPASYVNFLIVNHGVLVPTFRQPARDAQAIGILEELFPRREVIGLDSLDLVEEGGSLHCLTQQQPAAGL